MQCAQHDEMELSSQFIQNLSICFHQYIKLKTEMRATITTATTTKKKRQKKKQFHSICTIVKQLIVSSSNCVYFIRFNFRRHRTLFLTQTHTHTMCHATLPPQVQTRILSIYVIKLFIFRKIFHLIFTCHNNMMSMWSVWVFLVLLLSLSEAHSFFNQIMTSKTKKNSHFICTEFDCLSL